MATLPPVTPSSSSSMSTSNFMLPTGGGSWDGQDSLTVRILSWIMKRSYLSLFCPRLSQKTEAQVFHLRRIEGLG